MTDQITDSSGPRLLAALLDTMPEVSRQVLAVYARETHEAKLKSDESPVTEADELAEALICTRLQELTPEVPIVAEEAVAAGRAPQLDGQTFWLVDPLDGTKEFLSRNGEFTVNVALICNGVPILGIVAAPALGILWAAAPGVPPFVENAYGERRALRTRNVPSEGLTVMGSRSHGDQAALERLLRGQRVARLVAAGSSLKLCRVAEGSADLYPRLGRTMEWDIAAGHAVLLAAGGDVTTLAGQPLRYGKPGFENPHFVAHGRPWVAQQPS